MIVFKIFLLVGRSGIASVFGSVSKGLERDLSDLDILVDTTSETTLFDLGAIRYKLRNLLVVPVDVPTPGAFQIEFKENSLTNHFQRRSNLRL